MTENIPLLPILSPVSLFDKLFMGVSGGGGGGADATRLLKARKSVLDCARGQLGRLKTLASRPRIPNLIIYACYRAAEANANVNAVIRATRQVLGQVSFLSPL